MEQTYKYRAYPTGVVADEARRAIDICREVYNHALGKYDAAPEGNKPSYTDLQNRLPNWKSTWESWTTVSAKCLQMAVRRIFSSLSVLTSLKEKGYDVGKLKWKKPREFRSIVFNQSGFDVDSNTGRTDHATLELSKIGTMDLEYHRDIPADGTIKEVRLKEEKSGDWYASIVVDVDPEYPKKPAVETIDVEDTVGIDVGIQKFTHDSNGVAVAPLDETALRERIEKRHRALSRKEHDSNNWDRARKLLAAAYERVTHRRKDFREKLAHLYTTKYDAVFLEDLSVRSMLEGNRNSRNMAAMSWSETVSTFERHGDKNGCHVITVPPKGTTKECANCGVATEKPLWVREHSCPACGYEADRDENAAYNIQMRGLDEVGIEYDQNTLIGLGEAESTSSESRSNSDVEGNRRLPDHWKSSISKMRTRAKLSLTPVETALPTGTSFSTVPAKRVVEAGSHGSPEPW